MAKTERILPNLGPTSEPGLPRSGLRPPTEIRALGAVETYARLRFRFGNRVTRNMLHALAAGPGRHSLDRAVPEHKAELDAALARRMTETG